VAASGVPMAARFLVSSRGLWWLPWVEEREGRVRHAKGCREEDGGELPPIMVDDGNAWVKSGVGQSPPVAGGEKKWQRGRPWAVLFRPAGREREEWPISRGATWREGAGRAPTQR
jgi:hypothetical protein